MTQNIYDRPDFFAAYARLPRQMQGLAGAPEWPALRALLPDLRGRKILDLGCGFGWFCRFAREQGAAHALGLDVSDNMLKRARATTHDPAIEYRKTDLEELELPPTCFDLAYSSLALHYIVDFGKLIAAVHAALAPSGHLVFSTEHPIVTAPARPQWRSDPQGRKTWPVDRYLDEGARTTDWLTKGVIKQHRTIGTMLNVLIGAGFTIAHVDEWGPTPEQIAQHPEWEMERERPMFLLVGATR